MKKTYKKVLTVATVAAMMTTMAAPAFAANGDFYDNSTNTPYNALSYQTNATVFNAMIMGLILHPDTFVFENNNQEYNYSKMLTAINTQMALGKTVGDAFTMAKADPANVDVKGTTTPAAVTVASVSAINATDVTIVLAAKPATDLVTADASQFALTVNGTAVAAPTAVAKVASDLTGKTYKLTIATLADQQGNLAVNAIAKAFDFKSPEVTSIVTKGPNSIEITFNEAIKSATSIPTNFLLSKATGTAIVPGATKPVLSADGTKVTLTWTNAVNLTVADYVLTLGTTDTATATNRVKDVAGNSIYGGTEISFRPTADQLAVQEAPSLSTALYNNGTGELTLTFNKDVTAANVDVSKLTIGGIAIPADAAKVNVLTNSVKITLSADTLKTVNVVSGALSLIGVKDAWTDGTNATAGQTVAVTKVSPAVISSSSYNQETKVLTVNFDQAVKMLAPGNIKINDATDANVGTGLSATNVDGTTLDTTIASSTWALKLEASQATALENVANDKTKLKVFMDAGAVKNNTTTVIPNVATAYVDGVAVAYTADVTNPYITGAKYNNLTSTLTLTFNEALNAASVGNMNAGSAVKVATVATGDTNVTDLYGATLTLDATNKVLTVTGGTIANLDAQYSTGKAMKVWFAKDVLVDADGLKNVATTFDTGVTLTYNDFTAPRVDVATDTANQTYVKVVFSEKTDKTTAETAANYVIKDLSGATLAVNSAVLQADNKTVYLNTAAQVGGKPYTLTVSNVRDLQQNLVDPLYNSKDFVGSTLVSTGKLGVNATLAATAPINAKNDTLAVTFDAAASQTQALNLANYSVLEATADTTDAWAVATAVSLSDAKAELNANGNVVTLTLGSYNLQSGKAYKVVVSNVADVYGNALDATKTTAKTTLAPAGNLLEPTVLEANTKASAVKLVFGQELNATEAVKAANYLVGAAVPTQATYAWDAVKGKATVTLDLGTALTGTSAVSIKNTVTNLAGEVIASPDVAYDATTHFAGVSAPTALTDTVAPTVNTVVAIANPGSSLTLGGSDVITVTFADKDILSASVNASDIVLKDALGNVIPAADYTVAPSLTTGPLGVDQVTITFGNASPDDYNLQNGQNYVVTVSGVVDTSGNSVATTTKTATWDAATDVTAPVIATSGITVTTGPAGTGTVKVAFSEDVDVATATNKANYVVKSNTDGGATWSTTLTPTLVTYDATSKTATVYFAQALDSSINHYQVTIKNVKDLAGNVQVDGSTLAK